MQIVMYRTTKRDNSTATPNSAPGMFTQRIERDVKLKEPTDVLNPTFILYQRGHDGQNYLWAFGRYYWVVNIKYITDSTMEISCRIDPLGSYRGHIRNTQAYVLYDSTPNTEIPDGRLGVKTTATYSNNQVPMPWGFLTGTGTKFVALEGDGDLVRQGKADSATGVYIMTDSQIQNIGMPFNWNEIVDRMIYNSANLRAPFQMPGDNYTLDDMLNHLRNGTLWDKFMWGILATANMVPVSVLSLLETIKGLILGGDALKHVKSAYWLPFNFSSEGDLKSNIAIGSFVDNNLTGKLITDPILADEISIDIPWQYSDWRNVQNTEIQLFIPLIGNVNIPASAVKGHSTINLYFGINIFSGQLAVRARCGSTTIGSYGANVSAPILIGDSNPDSANIVNTVIAGASVVAGAVTGTGALTAGAMASTIQSGLGAISPISTSVGGIGGGIGNSLGSNIFCTTICHNTSDNPANLLNIIGTPTNVLKTLNGSGFCQTMQAHMNMNAVQGESFPTEAEVDQVNNALNSGVFLE